MNLLNGLAVADVGELQKNAQIGSIKARVMTIYALEQRRADKWVQKMSCCRLKENQAKPLCEKGHVMVLVESTENDNPWECDFCQEKNGDIEKKIGEKVKPWRCSEDFRVDMSKDQVRRVTTATNSCNYDICSRCIEKYLKKPLNFIKVTFSNSTEEKSWFKSIGLFKQEEDKFPDAIKYEARSRILRKKSADKTKRESKNEVHQMKAMFESEISEVRSDITEIRSAIEEMRSEMNENMNVIKSLLSAQVKPPV